MNYYTILLTAQQTASDPSVLEKIMTIIGKISDIFTFLGFGGVLAAIAFLGKNHRKIMNFFLQSKVPVLTKGYYTDSFLIDNIKNAKSVVSIFCVRNLRVSGADVLQEFKRACSRGVDVNIYWLSPNANESIIDDIMRTLPTPAQSVAMYKKQVDNGKELIMKECARWSNDAQKRLHLYEYNTLPTMHFCRFDNKLFLGFQIFDPDDDLGDDIKLGDFATVIDTKSDLGKLILRQVELLGTKLTSINQ